MATNGLFLVMGFMAIAPGPAAGLQVQVRWMWMWLTKPHMNGDGSSATENHSDGDTKVDLTTVGPNYFICPTPGHCLGDITVVASPFSPPPQTRSRLMEHMKLIQGQPRHQMMHQAD
ncbi:unnamed protein product [Arabidopsis thaliana]|uniref:(thale cress) hypothetical protein n=1 Tax=Arabidopsis thaliana TaxID=3702 RepID=A0A7G2EJ97_ARATH|nr:unnamed protein product [Arabidopsis thaliana]